MDRKTQRKSSGRLQVIGLCRFSHLGEGAFRQFADATMAERRAALFDPRRLDLRMIWFRHVFLPAVLAQTNEDFCMVVLTSDGLPEPWRSQLLDLTAGVAQISVAFRPPGPHREVCGEVIHAYEEAKAGVVAQFRLDDDDAIAVNYVERLRADHDLLSPLRQSQKLLALDYGKGLVLRDNRDHVTVSGRFTQSWAPGLNLFLPGGDHRSLLDFQHHRVAVRMAFVGLIDQVMFVRGAHEFNDAGVPEAGPSFPMPESGADRLLMDRFRIDRAAFEADLRAYHAAITG